MGDLDLFVEQDPVPGFVQADSELDIFNARASVTGIKASHLQKQRAPDSAAAAPKRRGFLAVLLVNEMMEEVAVLGKDIQRFRPGVVRTKDAIDRAIAVKGLDDLRQRFRVNTHIGVQEEEVLSTSDFRSLIAGCTGATL